MAEYSGFFNANETQSGVYDRVYNAEDFAKYFALFVGNGVFINPSNQLKVVPKTGLTVTVKAGKAFIDGYWYVLDEDMDITLSVNGTANIVNDLILCVLDKSSRTISVTKRENASVLIPTNNGTVHELVLAIVTVGVGVSTLNSGNITDTRPNNTYCGYVGALVEQVDFGNLFEQMESQFNVWFDGMKGKLTEDAAGNLQIQVDELGQQINGLEQKVDNGLIEVVSQISEKTTVIRGDVTSTGGAYVNYKLNIPVGFTSENCYVKSCMAKMVSGTGFSSNWVYGAEVSNVYTVGCELRSDGTINVTLQGSTRGIEGSLKLMVVLEKLEEQQGIQPF